MVKSFLMSEAQPWRRQFQACAAFALLVGVIFVVLAITDQWMILKDGSERCTAQFPKWIGCVLANHETLSGSLIAAAGALFAAWIAWRAIMAQIESDRVIARIAERAYVTGGPGARLIDEGTKKHTGIMSTGMNTGKTPAFTKRVSWGVCKKEDWPEVGRNWPHVNDAKSEIWEEVLPPQMDPTHHLYSIPCTATPIADDDIEYVCYGTIVYTTVFGDEITTAWKHSLVRRGDLWHSEALPGGYSSEWEVKKYAQ
jgi:hypothetical protein